MAAMEQEEASPHVLEKLIGSWKAYAHREKEEFIRRVQKSTAPSKEVSFRQEEKDSHSPPGQEPPPNKEIQQDPSAGKEEEKPPLAPSKKEKDPSKPPAKKNPAKAEEALKKAEERKRKRKEAEERRKEVEERKRIAAERRSEERKRKSEAAAGKKEEEKQIYEALLAEQERQKTLSREKDKERLRVRREKEKKRREEARILNEEKKQPESIFSLAEAQMHGLQNAKEGEDSLVLHQKSRGDQQEKAEKQSEKEEVNEKVKKEVNEKEEKDVQKKIELQATRETLPPSVLSSACSSTSSDSGAKRPPPLEGKESTNQSSLEKMGLDPSTTQKTEIRLTAQSSFGGVSPEKSEKDPPTERREEEEEKKEKESFKRVLPVREELDKVMAAIAPYLNEKNTAESKREEKIKEEKHIKKVDYPNQSFANLKPEELKEKTQGLKMLLNSIKSKGKEKEPLRKKEEALVSLVKKPEMLQKVFSPVMESSDEDNRDPKFSKKRWVDSPSMPRRLLLQDENQATTIFGPSINTKVNLKEMFSGIANLPADSPKKLLDPK